MNLNKQANHDQAILALARQQPLLRARDLAKYRLPTVVLSRLVRAGKLERVARGVYGLPSRALSEHSSLAEITVRVPMGIVCLLSALRVHDIGTQAPFEVWLALPPHTAAPKLDRPAIRAVHMSGLALTQGIDHIQVDGISVPVYSAAKTVADCFKFRNKIGIDVALEALHDGWRQGKLTMDALEHFAALNRVSHIMRPYLESMST